MDNIVNIHPQHLSSQGMLITDQAHLIVFADRKAAEILGKDPVGQLCTDYPTFFPCGIVQGNEQSWNNSEFPCRLCQENSAANEAVAYRAGTFKIESRAIHLCEPKFTGVVHILTPIETESQHKSQTPKTTVNSHYLLKIIGAHPVMQHLLELVRLVAGSDVTAHIFGENGTGKELVAEAIHELSSRREKQMVRLNCSTIPQTLLESTLFGHTKGAFTGAQKDQPGFVEAAEGGTLFLDEIGDIPPDIQVKLLRLLQSREYSRVGDTQTKKADVRIITATNRDLKQLMLDKKIREDFYYRVHVFPLTVPPLRERRSDIPLLIQHFITIFNQRYKKQVRGIGESALKLLMNQPWPGNVRELENALEHAFVLVNSNEITLEHIPEYLRPFLDPLTPSVDTAKLGICSHSTNEQERIFRALRATGGKKAEAAKLLGYSRITLWKKLKYLANSGAESAPPA